MSPHQFLLAVAGALLVRGFAPAIRAVLPGSLGLFVGEQLVARTCPEGVQVTAALVFDGHSHVVPIGCDARVFEPGRDSHLRVADAIEFRLAERAAALPVPQDPTAIVRDPPAQREPVFQLLAARGSDAWHEGRQFEEIPASELTEEQLRDLDASERAIADEWRRANDHEATVHNGEPAPGLVAECETDQAFVDAYDPSLDTAAE